MIEEPLYQLYGLLIAAYISDRMWEKGNDEEFKSNHKYETLLSRSMRPATGMF